MRLMVDCTNMINADCDTVKYMEKTKQHCFESEVEPEVCYQQTKCYAHENDNL